MSDKSSTKKSQSETIEQQFEQWLNGDAISEDIEQSPLWRTRANTANYLEHQGSIAKQHSVPKWDRTQGFSNEKSSWWQWQGLPALSMTMSAFALAVVLLNAELVIQPSGVTLSFNTFAEQPPNQLTRDDVEQRLKAFSLEQQLALSDYAVELSSKQQESNLQLVDYILTTSRRERKEDMSDFIDYINDKASDDKRQQQVAFRQLEQALLYKTYKQSPQHSRNTIDDSAGVATKTQWLSEE